MIEYIIKIKKKVKPIYSDAWVWKMAWRDARHNIARLFLFVASLITGIAGVVAIASLNYSLQSDLDRNAKELLEQTLWWVPIGPSNRKYWLFWIHPN